MSERRNDRTHFAALNGLGHRRKVVNRPQVDRVALDEIERRALQIISAVDYDMQLAAKGLRPRCDPGE